MLLWEDGIAKKLDVRFHDDSDAPMEPALAGSGSGSAGEGEDR
jgi:hypothetical protein